MRVLVTGHLGYIGVHLVAVLKQNNHYVAGCDVNLFEGCSFDDIIKPDVEYLKDFRKLSLEELAGYDCVMHLAAISNDPMGDLDEQVTYDINLYGTYELAKKCKEAGVRKFLFSGSCSVYGKGADSQPLKEDGSLNPVSAYAISKVESEKLISSLADQSFAPVYLRNATAYGFSPMLRIDLVANNFLACVYAKGEIRIQSDGTPWRPLVHCYDIARAFVALSEISDEKIRGLAVNIGSTSENYQVKDVADVVSTLHPGCPITYTGESPNDPRDYKVDFTLFSKLLPNFQFAYNLVSGIKELDEKFKEKKFGLVDFEGEKYVRLRALRKNLSKIQI